MPVSLAGDTGYSEGSLRELLEERNLTAYIPIHTKQENSMVAKGDFVYHGDHLSVPRARCCIVTLSSNGLGTYQYVARTRDCQSCPIKETCLPPRQKRRYFTLTTYHPVYRPVYLRARERNRTAAYRRERRRRQTIVEEIFASLDRLGWARSRLRGLWKVDGAGYMAALAHNVLKMVRRPGRGVGPPGSVAPADAIAASAGHTADDAVADFVAPLWCFAWVSWWTFYPRSALR